MPQSRSTAFPRHQTKKKVATYNDKSNITRHENIPNTFDPIKTPLLYSKTGVYSDIHYFSYF